MGKNEFKLPPVSPLIGAGLSNFNKILYGKRIDPPYRFKVFLTRLIILLLSPVRWYNKLVFQGKRLTAADRLKPVFILGHWRSGTTFVHNLLCQDPATVFVSTYQTVFPNYLASKRLLKPIMNRVMPSRRPGDGLILAPDNPQEEEFAISNMSDQSFYNFFYFPNHVGEYYHKYVKLDIDKKEKAKFADNYIKILQHAMLGNSEESRIVLKNPVNTARLDFLSKTFPLARFIHVYRNPYVVYLSTKRFFSELFPTLWLQEIDEKQLINMIIDLYLNLYDDYFDFKKKNPDFEVLEIPFEKFESDPISYISRFYESELGDDFSKIKSKFIAYIEKHKSYSKNRYEMSRIEYELISEKWSKNIILWGYQLPADVKIVD